MTPRFAIHPAIGIARLGNSPDSFYLAPDRIGGLPHACDDHGNPISHRGEPQPVRQFKDAQGRIRRQAARFRVFRYDDEHPEGVPVDLDAGDVERLEWQVHVASKKAAWYQFSELQGDLMLGPDNSYEKQGVPLRNAGITGTAERRKLIIDPGPRKLDGRKLSVELDRRSAPGDYPWTSFPTEDVLQGRPVESLGTVRTDDAGNLLVLGGYGRAGGDEPISSYAGADSWHDDVSDGPVRCTVHLRNGDTVALDAWVVTGSPKFAPELRNIVSLDDIQCDIAVRHFDAVPAMCRDGRFNPDYRADYKRDIAPILGRIADYPWVANVQAMQAFANPPFDTRDPSDANRANREGFFRYFRRPGKPLEDQRGQINQLYADDAQAPLMPLNSGTNSVNNAYIDKFLTLTETQYFLLGQWARGRFHTGGENHRFDVNELDRASVGNCVGSPMSPGIEVTWSVRNPKVYAAPWRVAHAHDAAYYHDNGLSPGRDETEGGGCEPGDWTKRMAVPWQADFFQCTVQMVNFTDPDTNKTPMGIPKPPTFYAYWWPPQSPWNVIVGGTTAEEQAAAGLPAGIQANFARGINGFTQMIVGWHHLGFIVNHNTEPDGARYPNFVEQERNHGAFQAASVAVGGVGNWVEAQNVTFQPTFFLRDDAAEPGTRAVTTAEDLGPPRRGGIRL